MSDHQRAMMELAYEAKTPEDIAVANEWAAELGLPPVPHDQLERNALAALSQSDVGGDGMDAHARHAEAVRALSRELDTKNHGVPTDAMSQLIENDIQHPDHIDHAAEAIGDMHHDAAATDLNARPGDETLRNVDNVEGRNLDELRHQLGTDRLGYDTTIKSLGMSPDAVNQLAGDMRELRHNGEDLSNLSPQQLAMWKLSHAGQFQNHRVDSPMDKIITKDQALGLASNLEWNGRQKQLGPFNDARGFVAGASPEGLSPTDELTRRGLDSEYHEGVNFFDANTNWFTPQIADPNTGGVHVLNFAADQDLLDHLQVPFDREARGLMLDEARQQAAAQESPSELGRTPFEWNLFEGEGEGNNFVAPHIGLHEHDGKASNPYLGIGSAATKRARAPGDGQPLPAYGNQELVVGKQQLEGYGDFWSKPLKEGDSVSEIQPDGTREPLVDFHGPGTSPTVTEDPAMRREMADYQVRELQKARAAHPDDPAIAAQLEQKKAERDALIAQQQLADEEAARANQASL